MGYFSGDGCRRDKDGDFWITGRVDDVINVSGHRIGTAEVESALVLHDSCAEAAVVGYEHPIKGQGIYAYVTLMEGKEYSDGLKKELVQVVRAKIGAFAAPDVIHWEPYEKASSLLTFNPQGDKGVHDSGVAEGGRVPKLVQLVVGYLPEDAAHDFSATSLWEPGRPVDDIRCSEGADFGPHNLHQLLLEAVAVLLALH